MLSPRRSRSRVLVLLLLLLLGCGGSTEPTSAAEAPASSTTFAEVAPATGPVALTSPHEDKPISGFVFANEGASDITISQIEVTLAAGNVIQGSAGVGVTGGSSVTFLFDSKATHEVTKLSFVVDGSTEKLVLTETDAIGPVPGTAPSPGAHSSPAR